MTRKKKVREVVESASSVLDVSMIAQGQNKDGASTSQKVNKVTTRGWRLGPGGVPVLDQTKRRVEIERLFLDGVTQPYVIAQRLGIDPLTVKKDLACIAEWYASRYDAEQLRRHIQAEMLDVAKTARGRYDAGAEGATVEGRLIVDALARLSKVTGLDETPAERDMSDAMARLLDRIAPYEHEDTVDGEARELDSSE